MAATDNQSDTITDPHSHLAAAGGSSNEQTPAPHVSVTAGFLLLTLLLRLAVLFIDGQRLQTDPDDYVRLAQMVADGNGYVGTDGSRPTAFRPVLYPLLLAAPMLLGCSAPIAVAVWNLFSGLLLVVATIALARHVGIGTTGRAAAGLLAACDPLLLRYSSQPMTENVAAALVALSILFVVRYVTASWRAGRPDIRTAIAAGALLGLSALCRPVTLVTCVLLTLAVFLQARKKQTGDAGDRQIITPAALAVMAVLPAIVAAITISPWIIRNAVRFGQFIPATTHGGYTLLLANNTEFFERVVSGRQKVWDGESLKRWQLQLRENLTGDGMDPADEPSSDRWMYQQAFQTMRNQPGMVMRAAVLRWRRFWALGPSAPVGNVPELLMLATVVWYACTGPGLVVSLAMIRTDRTGLRLLWLAIISFLVVHTFYWTNTRMRAPLTGIFAVLCVAGWSFIIAAAKPRLAVCRTESENASVSGGP